MTVSASSIAEVCSTVLIDSSSNGRDTVMSMLKEIFVKFVNFSLTQSTFRSIKLAKAEK